MGSQNEKLIFVTGLSGAGLSSVLKNLEDLGYEVFDNFPLSLIDPLLAEKQDQNAPIAIGIDSRTRGFSPDALIDKANKLNAYILFITCDSNVLQRRFTETRRKHPMAKDKSISEGIHAENEWLKPLMAEAGLSIDTSHFSIHDLRRVLEGHFAKNADDKMVISLLSFGFKNGLPREADIVMDVRFLKNPHWDEALRPHTGLDKLVQEHIESAPEFALFIDKFTNLMSFLLPEYEKEGKNYLTVAIGCTGGRHRSVFSVEYLRKLIEKEGYFVSAKHRDL